MDFTTFSSNLQKLLSRSGKSMRMVSEDTGITASALSRYLRNLRRPDLEYVIRLAEHFNVTVDSLLGLNTENKDGFLNTNLTAESINIAELYQQATLDDRQVIQAVLRKYKKVE